MGYALVDLQTTRFEARGLVIYANQPEILQEIEDSIHTKLARFETLMDEYQKTIVSADARKLYNNAMKIYTETYKPTLLKLLEDAKRGAGQDELMQLQLLRHAKENSDEMSNTLTEALKIKDNIVDGVSTACTDQTHVINVVLLGLLTVTVIISVVLGLYIAQHINTPLLTLAAFMKKASNTGDLIFTPEEQEKIARCTRKDEIGQTITSCAEFVKRVTDASVVLHAIAGGNFNTTFPLLSDKDIVGLSLKKLTNGLNFMMNRIESLLAEAQTANRAKSEFMSRMSHEMLTPMNAVIALTQFVKQFNIPDQGKKYLDMIDNASKQLLQLIHNVLEMSNMVSGEIELKHSVFSFQAMFDKVMKMVSPTIQEKRQMFTYHIDSSIPQSLLGDEDRLAKVIGCLLDNAVKFTPEEGEIRFAATVLGKDDGNTILQMEVADNGIGISNEQQRTLFDLFEQVDGSNTRKYGGIGLGLVLSKRIIETMGGKIWVDSEPGKGAKVTFICAVQEPA